MKQIPLFLCALAALGVGLVSCAPLTGKPIDTATALAKPTEIASTAVTPTAVSPTPTPEATATPEASDLKPNYEQNVSMEYMGVNIDASLITDESLDPVITKVTVGESAYAEFVARSIYKVWLTKGGLEGKGPATATTFEQFMALWAKAQQSGLEADWRQVQVKNIWANEISTPGYEQEPYTVWFMYNGQAPEDVKGISKVSIALVKTSKMKNIVDCGDYVDNTGIGTNIEDGNMYFYAGRNNSPTAGSTAVFMSIFPSWLIRNSGSHTSNCSITADHNLGAILDNGGITQKP